jgi:tRNA(fMet)-specific endonuclease VapC
VDRLILDTTMLVAGDRGIFDPESLPTPADTAVPAIAIAEYLLGTHRMADARRRRESRAFLEDALEVLTVEDYTQRVAEHHAELLDHVRTAGRPRGAHDLIVAATARATNRTILTLDRRAAFDDLPGVAVAVL